MNATELYQAGQLDEAIAAQVAEVKARPTDQGRRLFLFELLAFAGELDRAQRQIAAVNYGEADLDMATLNYAKLMESELARRRFFGEGIEPEILGTKTDSMTLRIEAAGMLRLGRAVEARTLIDQANESMPAVVGKLNGRPFAFLRDADDLLAGVLEVMAQGKYFWIGLEQVVGIGTKPPRHPRDLLYLPARLDLEAETGEVFLPAIYPGTSAQTDPQLKLGRATDWTTAEGGPTLGLGARLFLVDDAEMSLLECREFVGSVEADSEPA